MHVHEAAGYVEQDAGALLPLQGGLGSVHQAIVEGATVHELEHEAAPGPIERDGEQAVDVRVTDAAEQLYFGLDLVAWGSQWT